MRQPLQKTLRRTCLIAMFFVCNLVSTVAAIGQVPANDDFTNGAELTGASGSVLGTNIGATVESGEWMHAGSGGSSVWFRWTSGMADGTRISTIGSDFDTILGVYTGTSVVALTEVASNDDTGGLASVVLFRSTPGTTYHIAVDGFAGQQGNIQLSWEPFELLPPVDCAAAQPHRVDRVDGRVLDSVIYGEDDRREVYEEANPRVLEAWSATGALVDSAAIEADGDGSWRLVGETFQAGGGVCAGEPYADQPLVSFCSGFLVEPDVVATAAHCLTEVAPESFFFVFGFRMLDADTVTCTFAGEFVYGVNRVIASELDGNSGSDWALLRLDRPVRGVTPLTLRSKGRIENDTEVLIIGHPVGLPAKIADGATVLDSSPEAFFVTDLDAYGGNSGSAVLNVETLEVEGILVRGESPDFVIDGSCVHSRVCQPGECRGEDVTRTEMFASFVSNGGSQLPGDCNQDARIDLSDAICLFGGLFIGVPELFPCGNGSLSDPGNISLLDWQPDGTVDLSDGISLLMHLFSGASPHPLVVPGQELTACVPILGCEATVDCP